MSLYILVSNSPTITGPFSPFILRYYYNSSGKVWRCFRGGVFFGELSVVFPPKLNTCCQKVEAVSLNGPFFQE